jgi:hypothetical protein
MRSSAGVLEVIHGLDDRLLIGPPLLDGLASSTIEHDFMRLVREWMVGGRLPPGTSPRPYPLDERSDEPTRA